MADDLDICPRCHGCGFANPAEGIETCPLCHGLGGVPIVADEPDAGEVMLERFPPGTKDIQSPIIIVHQLRASADIQRRAITRQMGRPATTDRAELMRKAADTIEALAAAHEAGKREGRALQPVTNAYTLEAGYHEGIAAAADAVERMNQDALGYEWIGGSVWDNIIRRAVSTIRALSKEKADG